MHIITIPDKAKSRVIGRQKAADLKRNPLREEVINYETRDNNSAVLLPNQLIHDCIC
jgi:hypothetical protein